MLKALNRPLPPNRLFLSGLFVVAAIAFYCVAYTAMAGRAESPLTATAWATANVLPWFLAFEFGKRAKEPPQRYGWIVSGFALSLLLQLWFFGFEAGFAFEAMRRVPGAAATAGLLALGSAAEIRAIAAKARLEDLPVAPMQIDWVAAAGNYVELHCGQRPYLVRASLAAAEERLRPHGFVRIHRCILVRRSAIDRIRPADVVLRDGTSLKTGKRFRTALGQAG